MKLPQNLKSRRNLINAFTLLELLAVIAIIAILAAILVPVLSNMQRIGLKAKSVSNLRQIGIALNSYVANNGRYPDPTLTGGTYGAWNPSAATKLASFSWPDILFPDEGSPHKFAFFPSDPDYANLSDEGEIEKLRRSYRYRIAFCAFPLITARPLVPALLVTPTRQIVFHEFGDWTSKNPQPLEPRLAGVERRVNVLFADGHVQSNYTGFTDRDANWMDVPVGRSPLASHRSAVVIP